MALQLVHFCINGTDSLPSNVEVVNVGGTCEYAAHTLYACVADPAAEGAGLTVSVPDCPDGPYTVCWDDTEGSLIALIPDDCCVEECDCTSMDCPTDWYSESPHLEYGPIGGFSGCILLNCDDTGTIYLWTLIAGMGSVTFTCQGDHWHFSASTTYNGQTVNIVDADWPCGGGGIFGTQLPMGHVTYTIDGVDWEIHYSGGDCDD